MDRPLVALAHGRARSSTIPFSCISSEPSVAEESSELSSEARNFFRIWLRVPPLISPPMITPSFLQVKMGAG